MNELDFSGVQDTLFIPLMLSRKYVSEVFPEFFYDEKSIEIASKFSAESIIEKSTEYDMIASANRSVLMDSLVQDFATTYEKSNIVCIGCGFETTVWRLADYKDKLYFYDIDFQSVIAKRKEILGTFENETLISGDVNKLDFKKHMDCEVPTLFLVSGVFEYFKEDEVVSLIHKLQGQFKNSEMIFDTVSSAGLKFVNRYVKKTGNTDAMMYFAINDGEDFAKVSGTKLVTQQSIYTKMSKEFKKKLKLYTIYCINGITIV